MNPEDEYDYNITDINIHSFNNKADKGDDDFEDWLAYEAPLTISNTDSTITLTQPTFTVDADGGVPYSRHSKKIKELAYSMPIDILYKWYPHMEDDFDDDIPF